MRKIHFLSILLFSAAASFLLADNVKDIPKNDPALVNPEFKEPFPRNGIHYVPGFILVKFNLSFGDDRIDAVIAKIGSIRCYWSRNKTYSVLLRKDLTVEKAIAAVKDGPFVAEAGPFYEYSPFLNPVQTHSPTPTPSPAVPRHHNSGIVNLPGQIVIQFKPNVTKKEAKRIIEKFGSILEYDNFNFDSFKDAYVVYISNGMSVEDVIRKLESEPGVKKAEPQKMVIGR